MTVTEPHSRTGRHCEFFLDRPNLIFHEKFRDQCRKWSIGVLSNVLWINGISIFNISIKTGVCFIIIIVLDCQISVQLKKKARLYVYRPRTPYNPYSDPRLQLRLWHHRRHQKHTADTLTTSTSLIHRTCRIVDMSLNDETSSLKSNKWSDKNVHFHDNDFLEPQVRRSSRLEPIV